MDKNDRNVDWEDIENKIALICYKFSNLSHLHEDLAQELRIHAYYVSDNYYDLYRKAIDFWRKVQTRQAPEIPYFDLEVLNPSYEENYHDQLKEIVKLVKIELNRPGYNKWDEDKLEIARTLFNLILQDIDPTMVDREIITGKSSLNHYFNHRLNLSWVYEETGIGYKKLAVAMKLLEDIVRGLAAMNKIEIPMCYFEGYYE